MKPREKSSDKTSASISLAESTGFDQALKLITGKLAQLITIPAKTTMLSYIIKKHKLQVPDMQRDDFKAQRVGQAENTTIFSTEDAVLAFRKIWNEKLIGLKEDLYAIYLDDAHQIIASQLITSAETTANNTDPAVIVGYGTLYSAQAILIAHNHPSGVNKASASDIQFTKELAAMCHALNIEFKDHLILTDNKHYSFKDNSLIL